MKMKTNKLTSAIILAFLALGFVSCEDEDEGTPATETNSFAVTMNMKQVVQGSMVQLNTADKPYQNASGENFKVSKLRYLISDVTFNKSDGSSFQIEGYHLVDLADMSTLTYTPSTKVPSGNYSSISFTFGFDTTDNVSAAYQDLNSTNWGWPGMIGGGYHFMQLEGVYDSTGTGGDTTALPFATHMGTAANNPSAPGVFEANHFIAQPSNSAVNVNSNFSFDVVMNIEEWYDNPISWSFDEIEFRRMIMPKYAAQKRLNENGSSVFTIENIQ